MEEFLKDEVDYINVRHCGGKTMILTLPSVEIMNHELTNEKDWFNNWFEEVHEWR